MEDRVLFRIVRRRNRDLNLWFCGYEECSPLHSWGPVVRTNYIIHYILSGRGIFQTKDHTWELKAGEGFLIEPDVLTFYQADKEEPWTYIWVGFDGAQAKELLTDLGLGKERLIFRCSHREELRETVFSMLKTEGHSMSDELYLNSLLYRMFSILFRDMEIRLPSEKGENSYADMAIGFIRSYFGEPIQVEDIANFVNVDRSYLYRIFKKETGISPSTYLTNFRLTRAAELLSLTDYTVESIANSCGYLDALVFSKAFKKYYGLPPLKFRKRERVNRSKDKPEDF